MNAKHGLLLFAHGARDAGWAEPFQAVATKVRGLQPGLAVELAFLEFMTPTLLEAGRRLAAGGCVRVSIVPLFLGAGGHVRKDIPTMLDELRREHPAVDWRLQQAIGEAANVIEAMAVAAASLADSE